jgi:hypothetical protein
VFAASFLLLNVQRFEDAYDEAIKKEKANNKK